MKSQSMHPGDTYFIRDPLSVPGTHLNDHVWVQGTHYIKNLATSLDVIYLYIYWIWFHCEMAQVFFLDLKAA